VRPGGREPLVLAGGSHVPGDSVGNTGSGRQVGIMHRGHVVRVAGIATAALVGLAAPAGAFECYNALRSAQGNRSAAGANALFSIEEILADPEVVGLCPEGVDFVIAGLEEAGFRTDVLINFRTLMASGLERTHPESSKTGRGSTTSPRRSSPRSTR
jgi:hypothetical protein